MTRLWALLLAGVVLLFTFNPGMALLRSQLTSAGSFVILVNDVAAAQARFTDAQKALRAVRRALRRAERRGGDVEAAIAALERAEIKLLRAHRALAQARQARHRQVNQEQTAAQQQQVTEDQPAPEDRRVRQRQEIGQVVDRKPIVVMEQRAAQEQTSVQEFIGQKHQQGHKAHQDTAEEATEGPERHLQEPIRGTITLDADQDAHSDVRHAGTGVTVGWVLIIILVAFSPLALATLVKAGWRRCNPDPEVEVESEFGCSQEREFKQTSHADSERASEPKSQTPQPQQAQKPDWWSVLGISSDADLQTIKAAYHRLVRKFHPDAQTEHGSNAFMAAINQAYEDAKKSCAPG
jgi:DnaJ domain